MPRIPLSKGICPLCGKEAYSAKTDFGMDTGIITGSAIQLADGNWLCGSCVRKLRIFCHVENGIDPIASYTTSQAINAEAEVVDFREDLRERYGYKNAVFIAEGISVEKGDYLKPNITTVFGRVLYGTFFMLDNVEINGSISRIVLIESGAERKTFTSQMITEFYQTRVLHACRAETGESCQLVFQDREITLRPGDIITK